MKLSSITTALVLGFQQADFIRIDPDKAVIGAEIPVRSTDTFEHEGATHSIVRTRQETPNVTIPLDTPEGVDSVVIRDAYLADDVMHLTINGAVIRDTYISGDEYALAVQ